MDEVLKWRRMFFFLLVDENVDNEVVIVEKNGKYVYVKMLC